jgi:UDP-N-acetylmuramoyl-tripeptide--D-alanyl-D-alanine ligase
MAYSGVATDTRALAGGELFVALRGDVHDAHEFLEAAAAAGATGAVVEQVPDPAPSLRWYVVPDTLTALGMLGRFRRRRLGARLCAVTGTNGKTTTKELLRAVLSTRGTVHATGGNFNNLVGAPLTLLGAPDDTRTIVAELGTNAPGEIARLAGIVEPDAAVITGVGPGHLEGLGDLAGVLREKTSLLSWLPEGGVAVVADEPAALPARARQLTGRVLVAGTGDGADREFRADDVRLDDEGRVSFTWRGQGVRLRLRGRHNARNAALALALGTEWGVEDAAAIDALAGLEPPKMRSELHRIGSMVVIADCYNANPASVDAAVDLLASLPRRGGRVAVLGSMLELGGESDALHGEAASAIAGRELDRIVATGEFARAFAPFAEQLGERLIAESDPLSAFDRLAPLLRGDEVVLLKGSRGVALERLLPRIEENWGVLHPHGEASGPRATKSVTGECGDASPAEHFPDVEADRRDGAGG